MRYFRRKKVNKQSCCNVFPYHLNISHSPASYEFLVFLVVLQSDFMWLNNRQELGVAGSPGRINHNRFGQAEEWAVSLGPETPIEHKHTSILSLEKQNRMVRTYSNSAHAEPWLPTAPS